MTNEQEIHSQSSSGNVFARAGVPFPIILSRRLLDHYRFPADEFAPQRIELAWVVRLVLSGCLPSRQIETQRGLARVAEYNCVDHPAEERHFAVVSSPDGKAVQVVLPEEMTIQPKQSFVLLVEDDVDVAVCGRMMLEAAGYVTSTARNGVEAWALLDSVLPDAILTDVDMPQMDGIELCQRIRSVPHLSEIPILVWSGNPGHQRAVMDAGATAFIGKPVDFPELRDRLRSLLGR